MRLLRWVGSLPARFSRWVNQPAMPDSRGRPPLPKSVPVYKANGKPASRVVVIRDTAVGEQYAGSLWARVDFNGYAVGDMLRQASQNPARLEMMFRRMARAVDEVNERALERQRILAEGGKVTTRRKRAKKRPSPR